MQWIEVCIKTTSQAIELVGERLTMLGFDSFIMDDQDEFHEFLENNKQYWDYVDEGLEKQMQGLSQIRLYLEDSPAAPETISYLKDQLRLLPQQYPTIEFGTLDVTLEHVKDDVHGRARAPHSGGRRGPGPWKRQRHIVHYCASSRRAARHGRGH